MQEGSRTCTWRKAAQPVCCEQVAWQLGSNAKRFLPRLSGKLSGISSMQSDAARYVITQQDNTLRIVNLAAMKASKRTSDLLHVQVRRAFWFQRRYIITKEPSQRLWLHVGRWSSPSMG